MFPHRDTGIIAVRLELQTEEFGLSLSTLILEGGWQSSGTLRRVV